MSHAAALYVGNDNPGQRLLAFGRNGAEAVLFNPDSNAYVAHSIPVNADTPDGVKASLFNGTAYIDGVPGQSLVPGTTYHEYIFLPPGGGQAQFNFTNRAFSAGDRYRINASLHPMGMPEWIDPQGNRCLLVGMCYPVMDPSGPTIASIPYGYPPSATSSPRLLHSPSPWNDSAAQPLPITTGQAGGAIAGATPHEINPQYHRIIACAWAWRGVWSLLEGFATGDTAGSEIIGMVKCRSLSFPGVSAPTLTPSEATCSAAGYKVLISAHSALALDDGVYEFSFWGACSAGNASYNVTHTLHGYF